MGKPQKLPKIPFSHTLLEYEFRLAHLHSKIWCFFTSGKQDLV
jgi:hypothetical protein